MNNTFRNIIAVIIGWLVGSAINMSLITLGHYILPIEGLDTTNLEELSEVMISLDFEYFIFPFLAHALGTLVGSIVASVIAKHQKRLMAFIVGVIFFLSGVVASILIDSPLWFIVLDLLLAYIPMSILGYYIVIKFKK